MQVLLIPLAGDRYALELTAVREVLPVPPLTSAPGAPPALQGMFNLHGNVVALLDTPALLGLPETEARYAVVLDTPGGPAALTADGLPAIARLEDPAGPAELPAAVARFATDGGEVATLLDVAALVGRLGA